MAQYVRFTISRFTLMILILFTTIGCDQITKVVARDILPLTGPVSYLGDGLRLEYARNAGAFLSLGANLSHSTRFLIFNIAVALGLLVLAISLVRNRRLHPAALVGATLILGGGLGNLIDRMRFGSVTDFLIVAVGPLQTGIFNVADMAIVLGIALFTYRAARVPKNNSIH